MRFKKQTTEISRIRIYYDEKYAEGYTADGCVRLDVKQAELLAGKLKMEVTWDDDEETIYELPHRTHYKSSRQYHHAVEHRRKAEERRRKAEKRRRNCSTESEERHVFIRVMNGVQDYAEVTLRHRWFKATLQEIYRMFPEIQETIEAWLPKAIAFSSGKSCCDPRIFYYPGGLYGKTRWLRI